MIPQRSLVAVGSLRAISIHVSPSDQKGPGADVRNQQPQSSNVTFWIQSWSAWGSRRHSGQKRMRSAGTPGYPTCSTWFATMQIIASLWIFPHFENTWCCLALAWQGLAREKWFTVIQWSELAMQIWWLLQNCVQAARRSKASSRKQEVYVYFGAWES